MSEPVELSVNGSRVTVPAGAMVSTAVALSGETAYRRSVAGEPRSPLCGMGICFECRVTIDGREHCRSCQIPCEPGMDVRTSGSGAAVPACFPGPTRTAGHYDVLVIGAGPAGLAAARSATACGASVAVVDDNPEPGGQIWRAPTAIPAEWSRGSCLGRARVLAAPAPGRIVLERPEGAVEIAYRSLVLATGARERFLPFPGWTLPNVMGAGGLQALVKSGFPVRGKRVIVAGTGPLLLAVARYLRRHGACVELIAEQADRGVLARFAIGLSHWPSKLIQAAGLRAALLGVRYLTSTWPVEARGEEKLESVTLRSGTSVWTEPCDFLACGFGLVPNIELPALLGGSGGGGVEVDEFQQTPVEGIYCAGEVTGIGGLELSLVEGEIAGLAAAGRPENARRLFPARERHSRFAAALNRTFALRAELKAMPQDDTLICRCEDVAFGRVRHFSGWREAKLHTRCGMGPCQGRVCGAAAEFLLGWKPESTRPPVFPARIGTLAGP